MTWKGIMHPLPQKVVGFPSISINDGLQWPPSGAKRRPCKGTCGTKRCRGMHRYSFIHITCIYICALMLLSKCFVKVIRLTPLRHDDLLPLGACKNSSRWNERRNANATNPQQQHLAESSPSVSKLPGFLLRGVWSETTSQGKKCSEKNIGWILRGI